jgi:putative transposase
MLPREYPPWGTVHWYFGRWQLDGVWHRIHEAVRRATCRHAGRDPEPSAGVLDSQSVRTAGGSRGYAVGKRVNGRKRHILVDTDGQLIAAHVTPASLSDHKGLKRLLAGLKPLVPRLRAIWADSAYAGDRLAAWCAAAGGCQLAIVRRRPVPRFEVPPRRSIVERTFAWVSRNRRLARDDERKVQTTEASIEIAMIRLMLRRLGRV